MNADLEIASDHEKAGRHDAALISIVGAVKAGNPEAMNRLGKKLLIGDFAPHLPKDGIGLLLEASEKGNAEAPAILSVLQALGYHFSQNWNQSIESLVLSARRGWKSAQGQLEILAIAGCCSKNANWQEMSTQVDVESWINNGQEHVLCADPLIKSYKQFATPEICQWIIGRSRLRLKRAEVYDAVNQSITVNETRTNSSASFNLLETDFINVMVQAKMAACVKIPNKHLEAATVLHYAKGQEITEHFDFIDPNVPNYEEQIKRNGQRVVTFLLYLNDDYSGGNTEFPKLGLSHKGQLGEGIYFTNALPDQSPDTRTLHAGRPPLEGEKFLVSQFIRNCPVF